MRTHRSYVLALTTVFVALWGLLAINPSHRDDWLLENVLTVLACALLASSYRPFPLSRISYTMIFLFLSLHTLGSHFTYAEVPYDAWFRSMTGTTFNELVGWERNNFDRVVHFCYGLFLAYPIREVFVRVAGVRILGILPAARSHDVELDAVRTHRMVCG